MFEKVRSIPPKTVSYCFDCGGVKEEIESGSHTFLLLAKNLKLVDESPEQSLQI